MQTTINLQEPFFYSIIPLIIIILVLFLLTCYLIFFRKTKANIKVEEIKEIPDKNTKNIQAIKNKYLKQLEEIENKYANNKITLRKAYQMISEAIRLFVFEVTDIETQNYCLSEIKRVSIPHLYELIEEYYEPEFASKSTRRF